MPCGNVDPLGVTSTPVADPAHNRLYVVAAVRPVHHELFVLDLATGAVAAHRTVDAPGADPRVHNQRAALTLGSDRVYVPFGGRFGDCGDYHGLVVGAPLDGSGDLTIFRLPTTREGGFWTPPGATVAPDGTLLLASGNSAGAARYDFGNSVVRVSADLGRIVDSWAPTDWAQLNRGDTDVGSTGPVLLGSRVFQIGKGGSA